MDMFVTLFKQLPLEVTVLSVLLLLLIYWLAELLFYKLPLRILRSVNIAVRGWPPPHCDADGELKPDEE